MHGEMARVGGRRVEGWHSLWSRCYTPAPPTFSSNSSGSFGRWGVVVAGPGALLRRRPSSSEDARETESEEPAAIGHGPSNLSLFCFLNWGNDYAKEREGFDEMV